MAGSMMLVLAVAITMCVITSEAYPRRPGLAYYQQLDHFYCTGLPQSMLENGVDGGCCTAKRKCQVIVPNGPDCWCDSLCYTYNDCCDDIDEIDCPEPPSPTPSQPTPAPIANQQLFNEHVHNSESDLEYRRPIPRRGRNHRYRY